MVLSSRSTSSWASSRSTSSWASSRSTGSWASSRSTGTWAGSRSTGEVRRGAADLRGDRDRHATGDLWAATRNPVVHQRWDVRFSRIEPADGAGRFRYATRVLPGLTVGGRRRHRGGAPSPDGTATSVLRFRCAHPLSLIRAGHGLLALRPGRRRASGSSPATTTRPAGAPPAALVDLAFRPLFGWATAWSFDRLRLWLEHGVTPERSRNQALARAGCPSGPASPSTGGWRRARPAGTPAARRPPRPGAAGAARPRIRSSTA